MKPKLAIVTGNSLKFNELSTRLSEFFDCEQKVLGGYIEIQGTAEEILRHKLIAAYEVFNEAVLVDDTSLHFEELGGFPGPYIKDFNRCLEAWQMGEKFAGTRVTVAARLGLCRAPGDIIIGLGEIAGDVIFPKTHDDQGRDFDLFVQVDGTDKPMIEMTPEEKNLHSHRGRALDSLLSKLK